MASSMQMLLIFVTISAIRSQTILSGMCPSDNSQLAFLMTDDQCPVISQSGNETAVPRTSVFKIQIKVPEVNSTMAPKSQMKLRQINVPQKMPEVNSTMAPKSQMKLRQIEVPEVNSTVAPKSQMKLRQIEVPQKVSTGRSLLTSSGHVTVKEVNENLIAELKATFRSSADHSRINKWEKVLQPLFVSLPKNAHGNLGHQAAMYILHRAFVRQHGWSMKGLEPRNTSGTTYKDWVPSYLLKSIEQLLGTQGINSQELAVLAATFEDLAHKEAIGRLREVYEVKKLPIDTPLTKHVAEEVVAAYMTVYTADMSDMGSEKTVENVLSMSFGLEPHTRRWLRSVQRNVTGSVVQWLSGSVAQYLNSSQTHPSASSNIKELDFRTTARIVEEVGERYGGFNDDECRDLKTVMTEHEDESKPGMLRLSDFYKAGMNQTYWNFNEKVDYLRVLGALDESGPEPHVIMPNYISSMANCIPVSSFYTVCCRSECESMMSHLELALQSPAAKPDSIVKAITAFALAESSGRYLKLSRSLLNLLEGIASSNGGLVPLHSREFAQWMHHAFPRECPVPQDASQNPQTPDEWLKEFGAGNAKASKKDMSWHMEKSSSAQIPKQPPVASMASLLSRPAQVPKQPPVATMASLLSRPASPLLIKQNPAPIFAHLISGGDAMSQHSQQLLPCVKSFEELEEPMPWDPQECAEEVFTQPKAEARKLKLQRLTHDDAAEHDMPGIMQDLEQFAEDGIMHGPEQKPMKLSLKALLSQPDIKPKESTDADMLWEVYNEPAQSYWEREDHLSQESDKAQVPQIPTIPPESSTTSLDQLSSPTLGEALESSVSQLSAVLFLAVFLTLVVVFQSAPTKAKLDKTYKPYRQINEARQHELLKSAAVASAWRSVGGCSSHDIGEFV